MFKKTSAKILVAYVLKLDVKKSHCSFFVNKSGANWYFYTSFDETN